MKPLVRIRDIDAVAYNFRLFKERADETGSICAPVMKAEVHGLQMKDVALAEVSGCYEIMVASGRESLIGSSDNLKTGKNLEYI